MGGPELLVYVRIAVAAIFDFMTEEDWRRLPLLLFEFNMVVSTLQFLTFIQKHSIARRKCLQCRLTSGFLSSLEFLKKS